MITTIGFRNIQKRHSDFRNFISESCEKDFKNVLIVLYIDQTRVLMEKKYIIENEQLFEKITDSILLFSFRNGQRE